MEQEECKEGCEKGNTAKKSGDLAWGAEGIVGLDAGRETEDARKVEPAAG